MKRKFLPNNSQEKNLIAVVVNKMVRFKIMFVLLFPIIFGVALAPTNQVFGTQVADEIIVTVNNRPILKSQLDKVIKREIILRKIKNPDVTLTNRDIAKIKRSKREELILYTLLKSEAIRLGVKIPKSEVDIEIRMEISQFSSEKAFYRFLYQLGTTMEEFRKEIEERLIRKKTIRKLADTENKVTEPMMRDYYEKNADHFMMVETRDMEHLTLFFPENATEKVKRKARNLMQSILKEINNGANLYDLKKKYETKQFNMSVNKLSHVSPGKLFQELDKELFNLKEGEIGSIHENKDGLHIIRCLKIHSPYLLSYEYCEYEIKERLHYLVFGPKEKNVVQELKKKADIKIYRY